MDNEGRTNAPEQFLDEKSQKEIVAKSLENIYAHTFLMNRSLDQNEVTKAFDYATKIIEPLKTKALTPQNYNQIYQSVSASLFQLNVSLQDEYRFTSRQVAEKYEEVQYYSGCLERLYLMVTVAPELSRRHIVPISDILDDLSDMARCAQDPIRALFFRHYLLSILKQYLPDSNEQETEKSIHFLLNNFAQMNRLWVRIADIMASDTRRNQRSDLSELIGTNIQRLSSLHGLNI